MKLDESRRVAVVTGASAGIGLATACQLVALGWQVIGVGRNPARIAQATTEITNAVRAPGSVTMLRGDFSLMAEVKQVAGEIASLTPRVDILINNAGGMRDRQIMTSEGLEATFSTNHLAPFLLTRELKPLLDVAVARAAPAAVRVIAVSSNGHSNSPGLDWADLQSLNDFSAGLAYCQAKLANLLFSRELTRRFGSDGIIAQTMHPGVVATNFAEHGGESIKAWYETVPDVLAPGQAAETLVWLATDPEGGRESGRYFYNRAEETPSLGAQDDVAAERLWLESEQLLASRDL